MGKVYSLPYEIKTLSDVIIMGNRSEGNMVRSFEYIPGSTLLGVFASHYIRNKLSRDMARSAHLDTKFYSWFLSGDLIFSNAYLTIREEWGERTRFFPAPLSLQADKKRQSEIYNLALLDDDPTRSTKPLGGYASFKANQVRKEAALKKLNFHHQRDDRIKGFSEEGNIFFYEALERGQIFTGEIAGSQESLREIKEMMGRSPTIRIGRSKHAQYGKARLTLFEIEPYAPPSIDPDEDTLILTLQSPAILLNQNGHPEVSDEILKHYLQEALETREFEIEACFAAVETFENFVAVWRMKKPLDQAFSAGSTFRVYFPAGLNDQTRSTLQRLASEGIGERRSEGFGKIRIQTDMSEMYSSAVKVSSEPARERPGGSPPEFVQAIMKAVLKEHALRETELMALRDAEAFTFARPSNSQLSRLEHLLIMSKNPKDFIRKLKDLRKSAKDGLVNCHNGRETLWHQLAGGSVPDRERIYVNIKDFVDFTAEIDAVDIRSDHSFHKEIYKTYWSAFFRRMRKLNRLEAAKQ